MSSATPFADLIAEAKSQPPRAAIVLGSGMGSAAARLRAVMSVPFVEVPGLEATSVPGHHGQLLLGDWAGQRVLLFAGRLHFYESGSWRTVTAPIHTARFLGASVILVTNAAGGIRDDLGPGSLMAIRDHIEWTRPYPWRPLTPSPSGPTGEGRNPIPYSPRLRHLLQKAAKQGGISLAEGVYAAVTGPCYETPAEIRALRVCGADAVGMSTAREIQTGFELGLECAGISLVTNRAAGLAQGPIQHEEVLAAAAAAGERLAQLIERFLGELE
jgi:inosine/guanosine/xanthosine phosphorylase family protein